MRKVRSMAVWLLDDAMIPFFELDAYESHHVVMTHYHFAHYVQYRLPMTAYGDLSRGLPRALRISENTG